MTITHYSITHDDGHQMEVRVDDSILTEKMLHDMNNFWFGAGDRLADADGNVLHAVLTLLASTCFHIQVEYGYSAAGLREEFDSREGWCKMDGSSGIFVESCDIPQFDSSDMSVKVLP